MVTRSTPSPVPAAAAATVSPTPPTRALRPVEVHEAAQAMRRSERARSRGPSTISDERMQRSIDNDEARARQLEANGPRPSTSDYAPRCSVCGQWPRRDDRGLCRGDGGLGHPYEPVGIVGLAVVR
jgi:hypothetical protein